MPWPQATDYNAAVQSPALCFADPDLRQGQVAGDLFGLPRPHAGNFADVYQVTGADGAAWAVKCFTRPVERLHERYQAISDHLKTRQPPFMVHFLYLEEGIRVKGQWYPVLKMRWVEGLRLNEFVGGNLDKPALLDRLAQMWVRLAQELREGRMAHGDLQHGNVLLVPGSKASSLALRLIDYDGLYVPALGELPSGEVGHPNYQHPQRLAEGLYDAEMDRFAHLVIYTALRCLRVGGLALWQRYDNGENLLFREQDFREPKKSKLWADLWALRDPSLRALVGHLLLASHGPALAVPLLDELLEAGTVRPLSASEEAQVRSLVTADTQVRRKPRAVGSGTDVIPPLPSPLMGEAGAAQSKAAEELPDFLREVSLVPAVAVAAPPPLPAAIAPPPLLASSSADTVAVRKPESGALSGPQLAPVMPAARVQQAALWSRQHWPILAGGLGGALLGLVLLIWALRPAPAPPPREPAPRLLPVGPVVLKAGSEQQLIIAVERDGSADALEVEARGLPTSVHLVQPGHFVAGRDDCALRLIADLDAEATQGEVKLLLLANGKALDEKVFILKVEAQPLPTLCDVPALEVQAGGQRRMVVKIDRHGYHGPLALRLDNLPDGVHQELVPGGPDDTELALVIRAAGNAATGGNAIPLTLLAGKSLAGQRLVSFTVVKPSDVARRVRLNAVGSLAVPPGKTMRLSFTLEREGVDGAVEVRIDRLPEGLTAPPVVLSAGQSEGALEVSAAEKLAGSFALSLLATAGGKSIAELDLEVRVPSTVPKPRPMVEAPGGKVEAVAFLTADHVQLDGKLYVGAAGKKGATVLLVHDLNYGRRGEDMAPLARALQDAGHTVLQFDLRGHGTSTRIDATFWSERLNKSALARGRPALAEAIDARMFPQQYWPWLVQDLAAARDFLDQRHENPDSPVNTFNLVVVGAGEGAALAALWLVAESHRYAVRQPGAAPKLEANSQAGELAGAVWLSLAQSLGRRQAPVGSWLTHSARYNNVPMRFLHGERDTTGAARDKQVLSEATGSLKLLNPFTSTEAVPGAAFAGSGLLGRQLETEALVAGFIAKVVGLHERPWARRGYKDLAYYWSSERGGPAGMAEAKRAGLEGADGLRLVPVDRLGVKLEGAPR